MFQSLGSLSHIIGFICGWYCEVASIKMISKAKLKPTLLKSTSCKIFNLNNSQWLCVSGHITMTNCLLIDSQFHFFLDNGRDVSANDHVHRSAQISKQVWSLGGALSRKITRDCRCHRQLCRRLWSRRTCLMWLDFNATLFCQSTTPQTTLCSTRHYVLGHQF